MRTAVLHQSSGERHRASFRALQVQLVEENAGRSFINGDVVNDSVEGTYVVTEVNMVAMSRGKRSSLKMGPLVSARLVS